MTQTEMFDKTLLQQFEEWKQTKGGNMILADLYEITAGFIGDWRETGIPVSMDYVYHIERHRLKLNKARIQAKGEKYGKVDGYSLNNNFTALCADHIMRHRPDWQGIFETRERRAN